MPNQRLSTQSTIIIILVVLLIAGVAHANSYDLNGDGVVDIQDIMLVASHWGENRVQQPISIHNTNVVGGYLVGEVINNTEHNVRYISIDVAFYDSSRYLVCTRGLGYTNANILAPGGKTSFDMYIDQYLCPHFASYDMGARYNLSDTPPTSFEVITHAVSYDSGALYVSGVVYNQYDQAYENAETHVTLYDANGSVIGVNSTYKELFSPEEEWSFSVTFREWAGKPNTIDHYSIQAVPQ